MHWSLWRKIKEHSKNSSWLDSEAVWVEEWRKKFNDTYQCVIILTDKIRKGIYI